MKMGDKGISQSATNWMKPSKEYSNKREPCLVDRSMRREVKNSKQKKEKRNKNAIKSYKERNVRSKRRERNNHRAQDERTLPIPPVNHPGISYPEKEAE